MDTSTETYSSLQKLAKADLHVHLEGTVSPELLFRLAERNKIKIDAATIIGDSTFPPPLFDKNLSPVLGTFYNFASLYVKIAQSLSRAADIIELIDRFGNDCEAQNIRHLEIYFSPYTFVLFGYDIDDLLLGLLRGSEIMSGRYGIPVKWIFDIVRSLPESSSKVIDLAIYARNGGLCVDAIGVGGPEVGNPASRLQHGLERAKLEGFTILAHTGETAGPESIEDTLNCCLPKRIGHGIHVLDDPVLVSRVRSLGIPLEVCPWSNVLLGIAEETNHPILELYNLGLKLLIGSDDPGIFAKSLTDNYFLAYTLGLPLEALEAIAATSLDSKLWSSYKTTNEAKGSSKDG